MPGSTIFAQTILPNSAPSLTNLQPTVLIGNSTIGTSVNGAILTGPATTIQMPNITTFPFDPTKTISNIYLIGNATCGTLQFDFNFIRADQTISFNFPATYTYQSPPIVVTSPANAAGAKVVNQGGAFFASSIDTDNNNYYIVMNTTNEINNGGSFQTAIISYSVFATALS